MKSIIETRRFRIGCALGVLFLSCACLTSSKPPHEEEAQPSWAPDSQRIVYECYLDGPIEPEFCSIFDDGPCQSRYTPDAADICVSDTSGHNQVHLTRDPGGDWRPRWSPDGSRIAYLRQDGIYLITPDGENQRQLVSLDPNQVLGWKRMEKGIVIWSPKGDRLLFSGCVEHWDHDVFIVDIETGTLTNLTPNSRVHDFAPTWTLDGSRIVFLSTDSSSSHECGPEEDALPQIKVMNADGDGEYIVYDPEFYYPYWQMSVSNSGQIAFITNMISKTYYDRYDNLSAKNDSLYVLDLKGTLIEVLSVEDDLESVQAPTWSPDGVYIAHEGNTRLEILNVRTGEEFEFPQVGIYFTDFVWSPDGQRLAVTTFAQDPIEHMAPPENHIHILDIQSGTVLSLVQGQGSP